MGLRVRDKLRVWYEHIYTQLNRKEIKSFSLLQRRVNNQTEKHATEPLSDKRLLFKNYKKTIQLTSKTYPVLKISK